MSRLSVQVEIPSDTIDQLLDYLEHHNQQAPIPVKLETLICAITESAINQPDQMKQILNEI